MVINRKEVLLWSLSLGLAVVGLSLLGGLIWLGTLFGISPIVSVLRFIIVFFITVIVALFVRIAVDEFFL